MIDRKKVHLETVSILLHRWLLDAGFEEIINAAEIQQALEEIEKALAE